jgi:hypothetical protein
MKKVLSIVILTFVVVLLWIAFSIYSIYIKKESLINVPQSYMQSFNTQMYSSQFKILLKNQSYLCVTKEFKSKKCLNSSIVN